MNSSTVRVLLPETLWLEPEHYDSAQQQSTPDTQTHSETHQWQRYISRLAQLSFQDWLAERLPKASISTRDSVNTIKDWPPVIGYLNADGFRLCIVSTEQALDESVNIPSSVLNSPELAAHYYVAIEVLEEQQQAIVRGFLSHSELTACLKNQPVSNRTTDYSLHLSALNPEPNHLIAYIQRLSPNAVTLPTVAPRQAAQRTSEASSLVAKLSDWLDETITAGWQAIDELLNPQMALALATRESDTAIKAGKLVNLGIQLGNRSVALVVSVVPEPDDKPEDNSTDKLSVLVQLLPTGIDQTLPEQIKLSLLSKSDSVLQEVIAREQDSYIQLRSFKGKKGIRFGVKIEIANIEVCESFEL